MPDFVSLNYELESDHFSVTVDSAQADTPATYLVTVVAILDDYPEVEHAYSSSIEIVVLPPIVSEEPADETV